MTDPHQYPSHDIKDSSKTSKKWPWIAGIVGAFVFGGVVGAATIEEPEPEIVTEVETVTETVEVEPADLEERREELADRESALDERGAQLDERGEDLDEQEEGLVAREEELEEAQANLDSREADISEEEEAVAANTISGSGTFLVGDEIEPGTYRTSGGNLCYWERLSGLSGEFHHIITNGLPEGTSYVTIAPTDVAFSTQSCGEWVRQ